MSCHEVALNSDNETPVDGEHPIFSKDPVQWMKLIHTQICATTEDGNQHKGWVYTVDPVSESIVLVDCLDSGTSPNDSTISVQILIGRTISQIEPLSMPLAGDNKIRQYCDRLFRPTLDTSLSLSKEDISKRRSNLKSWLEKHRIPVSDGARDGHSLSVLSDALIIQPPFTEESCLSTNEIILSKIQGLVKSMP